MLHLFFSVPTICATNNSFPSSFYVTFQGWHRPSSNDLNDPLRTLWVQFLNGTNCFPETVCFTFSMEESPEGTFTVKFILTFDDFYDEIFLPATVSNGRVFIDSTSTILVVDPASLIDGNIIQLYQTENLPRLGTVLSDGQPQTLIKNSRVASKVVRTSYQQTIGSSQIEVEPVLFFDPKTGVFTGSSTPFSDILLNKLGVEVISGGAIELLDYSENLNFTLLHTFSISTAVWVLILISIFVISFVLVVFLAYRTSKKKNKDRRKTYPNKSLKFHSTANKWCSYGL